MDIGIPLDILLFRDIHHATAPDKIRAIVKNNQTLNL